MSEAIVQTRSYDPGGMERMVRAARPYVNTVLGLVLPLLVLAVTAVTGQLAERILVSFSSAAGQKFETGTLWGLPVWLGNNFANLVKVGLWTAALTVIVRGMLQAAPTVGRSGLQTFIIAGGIAVVYAVIGLVFDFRKTEVPAPVLRQLWAAVGWFFGLAHDAGFLRVLALLLTVPAAVGALFAGVILPAATVRLLVRAAAPAALAVAVALGFGFPLFTGSPVTDPLLLLAAAGCVYVGLCTKTPAVALREFKAVMLSPLGYVVLVGFALAAALMFHRAVDRLAPMTAAGVRAAVSENSILALQPLTAFFAGGVLSFALLLIVPIITMRLAAEEKRSGTIEVLMTSPVNEWNVVAGKFLGALGFYLLLWAVAGVHIWWLHEFGLSESSEFASGIDLRQIAGAYIGLALIGSGLLAVGLFCSCLVSNQLAAAVLTLTFMLLFTFQSFVDLPTSGTWGWVGQAGAYLDLRSHLEWSARGTPDSRTVFLFLSITGLFLFAAVRVLEARRWTDVNLSAGRTAGKVTAALGGLALVAGIAYGVYLWKVGAEIAESPAAAAVQAGLVTAVLAGALLVRGRSDYHFALPIGAGALALMTMYLYRAASGAPDLGDDFNYTEPVLWAVIAGLAALIVYLVIMPRVYAGSLDGKLVYGANVLVCLLGVLFIGILVNYLAVRYHVYLDWSTDESFTLHPASMTALAGLPPEQRGPISQAREIARSLVEQQKKLADGAGTEGDQEAVLGGTNRLIASLERYSAAGEALQHLQSARSELRRAQDPKADPKAARAAALQSLRDAEKRLDLLLPEPAIRDGEMVRIIAFVGRYDPPKDRAEVNDNFRRDTLERLLRRFADSLNRPGNIKIGFGPAGSPDVEDAFIDPRSERRRDELRNLRNRYAVEGNRDVLLLYHDRQFALADEELFSLELTPRRFAELTAVWNREFERGLRRARPPEPTEANRLRFSDPKQIPPELAEYSIRDEDLELVTHKGPNGVEDIEEVLTNAVLRIVRGELNIVYFTQGHGERDVFPGADRKTAKTKAGPLGPEEPGEKEKDKDKDDAGGDPGRRRLAGARAALQKHNFQVRVLNRFGETVRGSAQGRAEHGIPADCRVLVICDPVEDFLKTEIEAMERYMKRGGKVVLMLDPRGTLPGPFSFRAKTEPRADTLPNLREFASKYGIEFEDTIAVLRPHFPQPGAREMAQVYMTAGSYRFASNPGENRWYNDVFLAQKNDNVEIIRTWQAEGRRESHPLFPGVVFHESRTLKASGQAEFTPVISLGRSRDPGMMMGGPPYAWGKHRVGGTTGPEPPTPPEGENPAVMAVARAKDGGVGGWMLVGVGDSDWLSDGIAEAQADEDKDRLPTYLQVWHRGGERLLVSLARYLCSDFARLTFTAKTPRPYRAAVERALPGELLVNFRPDLSAEQVNAVVEQIRRHAAKTQDKLESVTHEPFDLRRVYELRFRPKDYDASEVLHRLRAAEDVLEARAAPGDTPERPAVLVEFKPGTTADKVRAAAEAVGASDSISRTVRNRYRLRFDESKSAASAKRMIEAAAGRYELKSEAAARLDDVPEDVRKKLAALDEQFPTREKFQERLSSVLSAEETARYGARITRAAEPAVVDVQLHKVDLLGLAAVWIWGVLPAAVLAAALWVGVVRRQE